MSFKLEVPEKVFQDPNDFYTEDESNRYNQSSGMKKTQEELTKIALSLSSPFSNNLSLSVLDIGCGTGFSLEYLRYLGYLSLKGIDPSKEMIKIAKSKKLDVKIGGFQDLSKIYEKYDLILSISALQWVISNKSEIEIKNIIKKIAKDLKKILKEDGISIFQFYPDSETIFQTVFNAFKRFFINSEMFIYNSDSLKKRKFFLIIKS
ncbi:class I SAM-dependent methyltransferase [archaeon]|nr:class I SAM-dependent methyltransferase [archaeon]NCP79152.1 class I SAM-dependent methyltransferase [archaeon]NCP97901.1 class I SAM-dependent methyltransferase [archaeon]NCQ06919.1 class I SAM-dependent methyltransferase [archaeon]NCQ50715.1 class I SAM-dependent methyltransferase [archaeon]